MGKILHSFFGFSPSVYSIEKTLCHENTEDFCFGAIFSVYAISVSVFGLKFFFPG